MKRHALLQPSPEDQETTYILACLASRLFTDQPVPVPPAGLDWETLFHLLEQNRLDAYFYTLRSALGSSWPAGFVELLRATNYKIFLFNSQRLSRIAQVLSALRLAQVDGIVLKGWAYINTLYAGDMSARFCVDIDLLVRPQAFAEAAGVVQGLGCQPVSDSWPGYSGRYMGAQVYVSDDEDNPLQIGLHRGLFSKPVYDPAQVDMQALFSRTRPLDVAGVTVLELNPGDQIVYACAHLGLHHQYSPTLLYYYEIAALLRRFAPDLDRDAVLQRAREWRCIIPLQRVLTSLEDLWPGLVPPGLLDQAATLTPIFKERFVNWWIERARGRETFGHLLFWIFTPGLKRKLAIAFQDIFPSREYMLERYGPAPAGAWPLLYFARFFHSIRLMKRSR